MADEAEIARASYPLHGMVLCCTSVEMGERSEIQNKCEQMGARHILDLTSEVTHLICGSLFSPKYRYVSKMRLDMKIMSTRWVGAVHARWLLGEDIDPAAYEMEHRFPVLYGLKISVTGIADVAERKRIEEICQQESASYHPDLTMDVSHLIATAPTGKKYEFARRHMIVVVTPEWLTDSMERGMALDEQTYDPTLPPEQIGVGAKPLKATVQAEVAEVAELRGKRKIRKATQDKLGGQSQSLWDDIVGQAGNVKPAKRDEWEEPMNIDSDKPASNDRLDRRRNSTSTTPKPVPDSGPVSRAKSGGMFANACFWMCGFESTQTLSLRSAVLPHHGTIVSSLKELDATVGFIWKFVVVPRTKRIKDCPTIPEEMTMVTEWWLETCLHYQKLVTPTGDFTTTPIEEFEVEDMKGMDICITKFTGIDLLYYPRLVRLLGANFHEVMRKNRSLLIANSSRVDESDKIRFAHAHGVPVVTGEWLVECLKQNQKIPYETYRIAPVCSLGDRFKRKAAAELSNSNKKQHGMETVERKLGAKSGEEHKQLRQSSLTQNSESKGEPTPKALDGCTVCISKQLKKRNEGLGNIARDLGAAVLDNFDLSTQLTHLVHWAAPSKPLESIRDFRVAASIAGCSIVSPDWLFKCRETSNRANEKAYEICLGKEDNVNMTLAPTPMSGNQRESTPQVASAGPLVEFTSLRINETGSSSSNGSMEPLERKSSHLSGISEILGKFGKEQLTAAMASSGTHGKTRGRLQGKATAGKPRVFSRTPSAASMAEGAAASKAARAPSVSAEPSSTAGPEPLDIVPSQALGYNYEETAMEKKIVRAKLDKNAPLDTPRSLRTRVPKPKGAVDLVPVTRRSGRKKEGTGSIDRF